jgi:hypothetical protein
MKKHTNLIIVVLLLLLGLSIGLNIYYSRYISERKVPPSSAAGVKAIRP